MHAHSTLKADTTPFPSCSMPKDCGDSMMGADTTVSYILGLGLRKAFQGSLRGVLGKPELGRQRGWMTWNLPC
jgi:hypothetical protein